MTAKNPNEVSDTYEAAYYMTGGAKLVSVRKQVVPGGKQSKYLFGFRWHLTMSDIPKEMRDTWNNGGPVAFVKTIAANRKKIKRFVQQYG